MAFGKHGIRGFVINKNIRLKGCPGLAGNLESSLNKISVRRRKWDIYTGILPLRVETQKRTKQQTRRSWRKKFLNAYGSRSKYYQKSLGSSRNLNGHRNKSPNRRAHAGISKTAIKYAGETMDLIRKLFVKELCCPSQASSLDTGIDLQGAGPGEVLENWNSFASGTRLKSCTSRGSGTPDFFSYTSV